ncbi:glyoxalase [Myxococcota bacterium]|nr:glyoxalase [Myxococcota bacterium]
MQRVIFILYVSDQKRSRQFYESTLGYAPVLDVPGMTEFHLGGNTFLGLMPEVGIVRLLGPDMIDPAQGNGIPRAELYLHVDDPQKAVERALAAGGTMLSPLLPRDWGDRVAYIKGLDGHILALASPHKEATQ